MVYTDKNIYYYALKFCNFRPANPKKNLSHLSVQNLSDIISGKGKSIEGLMSLGENAYNIQKSSFTERSLDLMYEIPHKTKLLKIAQNYIGKITEATEEELSKMTYAQKAGTQLAIIQNHGYATDAWCAHTVSYMCNLANINIEGHKRSVQEFIDWGVKRNFYKPINTNPINPLNYTKERAFRTSQIKSQIKNMKEGDLIIWKSDCVSTTQLGLQQSQSSHIGILECINEDGTISVIEGNANELKTGKYEKYIATNAKEAQKGNQTIGEPQEINPRDGIIRKVYTPEQLAAGGYSGYINMQNIIK